MRLLKWFALFAIAFAVSWILIFTFTQPAFKLNVPARIFTYQTPAIPIYIYVASAFGVGLFFGLLVALYNSFILRAELGRRKKKIRGLETELSAAQQQLALRQADAREPAARDSFPQESANPEAFLESDKADPPKEDLGGGEQQ